MKSSHTSKTIFTLLSLALWTTSAFAHDEQTAHDEPAMGHHALVHPFLAHMGLPDEPGEVSLRVTSIEQRMSGKSDGTFGFHIEAGITDRLGLHLRNDGLGNHEYSEMMVQYAVLKSQSGLSGVAIIGELEFPTGDTTDRNSKTLFGISFAHQWKSILGVNSVIHYSTQEEMAEWEIAFVSRLTENIYPVLEFRGETSKDMSHSNALFAWKFKLPKDQTIGVGYQIPISPEREYDSQFLLQAEFGFN